LVIYKSYTKIHGQQNIKTRLNVSRCLQCFPIKKTNGISTSPACTTILSLQSRVVAIYTTGINIKERYFCFSHNICFTRLHNTHWLLSTTAYTGLSL